MTGAAVLGLVAEAEASGLRLSADADSVQVEWPATLDRDCLGSLLARLRERKPEVVELVRQRKITPPMPRGVLLLAWHLKPAPIMLQRWSVVTHTYKFALATLSDLSVRLADPNTRAVGWSVPELMERLEQVGVRVALEVES